MEDESLAQTVWAASGAKQNLYPVDKYPVCVYKGSASRSIE